jgi:hypothetical protein
MSVPEVQSVAPKQGRREPILLYQRFNEQVFWPCVGIMLTSVVLMIWTPDELQDRRVYLVALFVFTALLLAITYLYRLRSYAQCHKDHLRLQLPFSRLKIPYQDIQTTRPNDFYRIFPEKKMPRLQRHFLEPLMGKTAVVIDMRELPQPKAALRVSMGRYMISPETESIILSVRDWVAFRTELDEFRLRSRQFGD